MGFAAVTLIFSKWKKIYACNNENFPFLIIYALSHPYFQWNTYVGIAICAKMQSGRVFVTRLLGPFHKEVFNSQKRVLSYISSGKNAFRNPGKCKWDFVYSFECIMKYERRE